jgi:histidine triad (HIT) family protein
MGGSEKSCVFCKILRGEAPADIVHQDEDLIAFHDRNPQAPVHILIIPRKHITGVGGLEPGDAGLVGKIFLTARKIAEEQALDAGYRVVTNNGSSAGQSVYHLHFHLLAGRLFGWPPG